MNNKGLNAFNKYTKKNFRNSTNFAGKAMFLQALN